MKIFGIGYNKTGTTSLKRALKKLGYRHFEERSQAMKAYEHRDFDRIFAMVDAHDSFEDWPWPLMTRELLERYGKEAKFILTRRRTDAIWLESIKAHALRTHPERNPREAIFGARYPQGNERIYARKYNQHLSDMRGLFATDLGSEQMIELCWEEGDGWPELCEFLGQAVPEEDFPKVNVSAKVEIPKERLMANLAGIGAQKLE